MKATDKLRAWWFKRDDDLGGFYPLGMMTKSDLAFLLHHLEPIMQELERRGYDKRTLKFSIEPRAGEKRFASQR